MSHGYYADAEKKSKQRIRRWYQENLYKVLENAKERRVRGVDIAIGLANELMKILEEPVAIPAAITSHDVTPAVDDSLMTPVEPEVLDLLYGSKEKGASKRYFKARNMKAPEEKFFYRETTSWEYGWQQKQSRMRARDVNRGRCAILRDTFYRKNNLAPDPRHYSQPAGGQASICSEYSCNFG